jgi:hypothetical protein
LPLLLLPRPPRQRARCCLLCCCAGTALQQLHAAATAAAACKAAASACSPYLPLGASLSLSFTSSFTCNTQQKTANHQYAANLAVVALLYCACRILQWSAQLPRRHAACILAPVHRHVFIRHTKERRQQHRFAYVRQC